MGRTTSGAVQGANYRLYLPEAFMWLVGLIVLALMVPDKEHLFSFCPFSYLLAWCPGCGLGHAIAWLARGEFARSWEAHPLGVPAILMIAWRCLQLLRLHSNYKQNSFQINSETKTN